MRLTMHYRHLLAACAVVACTASAVAAVPAPPFDAADAWRRELRSAMERNWSELNAGGGRIADHGRTYQTLQARAGKLFGTDPTAEPWSACHRTVIMAADSWVAQSGALRGPDAAALSRVARTSFSTGESYAACRDAIDTLESRKR